MADTTSAQNWSNNNSAPGATQYSNGDEYDVAAVSFAGELITGYGASLDYYSSNIFYIQTFYGLRLADFMYLGVGVSYDNRIYLDQWHSRHWEDSFGLLANVKFFMPIGSGRHASLFASLTGGYMTDATRYGVDGVSLNPALGVSFKYSRNKAVNLSIGYDWQQWSYTNFPRETFLHNNNVISFKIGFEF